MASLYTVMVQCGADVSLLKAICLATGSIVGQPWAAVPQEQGVCSLGNASAIYRHLTPQLRI